MTIWIVAVLMIASLAGLGLRQGAIRVAASLIGILLGALLAVPIGNLLKPLFSMVGMKNPALLWIVPPLLVFAIILTLAKVGGLFLHKKVEVFYKYKAGDLRLALWERLNQRLGLCLGSLNALAYMVLICQAVYMVSYWTVQAASDSDPITMRLVNRMGRDLESTGMATVAASVDKTSDAYYDAADIAGLLYQTPELSERLSRYPGILSLAERPELQEMANDPDFVSLRERGAPIVEVVNHPRTQAVLNNAELLKAIESALVPNLKDLRAFLETGKSATFVEPILGRWNLDVTGTIALLRREKPSTTQREAVAWRNWLIQNAGNALFIATPEQEVYFKHAPTIHLGANLQPKVQSLQGEWKGANGRYTVSVSIDGKQESFLGELQGTRLNLVKPDMLGLTFVREE